MPIDQPLDPLAVGSQLTWVMLNRQLFGGQGRIDNALNLSARPLEDMLNRIELWRVGRQEDQPVP
jgi:hypothetical protein